MYNRSGRLRGEVPGADGGAAALTGYNALAMLISGRACLAGMAAKAMARAHEDVTRVQIDAESVTACVHPMLFGQFTAPGVVETVRQDVGGFGARFTFQFPAHSISLPAMEV